MKDNHFSTTLILLIIYFLQIILSQTEHESVKPPATTKEAFEILQNLDRSRTVKLYWTSSNAPSSSHNNTFLIELFISDNFIANFTTENTSFTISDLSLDLCEFRIYSQSPFGGISKNHSLIIVPHHSLISSVATNIIVQKIPGTNSYEITWDYFLNNHSNYVNCTVFWISEQSKSGLTWKYTTGNRTIVSLEDGDQSRYQFGVAVNWLDFSSGIVWSHCDTQLPIDELANVRAIKNDAHSIVLSWAFHCEPQTQLVDQFMLTYCNIDFCEFANDTNKMELKNQSHVHEFVIRYLGSNNTYYFELSSPFIRKKYALYVHIPVFIYPEPPPPDQFEIFYKKNQSSPILEWKFTSEYTNYFVLKIFKGDGLSRYSRNISLDYCDFMALKCVYDFSNSKIFFKPFAQYRFVAYSCTKFDDCSNGTVHSYLTPMTAPGKITVVFLEKISNIKYRVNVQKPDEPNGPISAYHVQQSNLELQHENIIFSGNQNYTEVEVKCSPRKNNNNQTKGGEQFEISIAASNRVDNSTELIGPYSDPLKIELCLEFEDLKVNLPTKLDIKTIIPIISILSGILIIIILSSVAYKTFIRYKVRKESLVIKVQCNNCENPDQKVWISTESTEITDDFSVVENTEKSTDNLVQQNKSNYNFITNQYLETEFTTDNYLEDFYVEDENELNVEINFNTKDKFKYVNPGEKQTLQL